MNNCCIPLIEPCHSDDCSGFDEVIKLLPVGQIWNPDRCGVYGKYIQALGHIKTELNKIICQEYNELDPCKSVRLFSYWADFYKLPPCVEQTGENLCEWISLIYGDCPIGSQGFLRRAIQFAMPGVIFDINFNIPDGFSQPWRADNLCADNNVIVITAPASEFAYYEYDGDYPHQKPDGENCRRYFIPAVECLRDCIFPIGLNVGYKTTETGDFDINNWQDIQEADRPKNAIICNSKTGELNDRVC